MKNTFLRAFIFAGFVLTLGVVANAQMSRQYTAEIPFDFQVKSHAFKAGTYKIGPVSSNTSVSALTLSPVDSNRIDVLGVVQLGSDEFKNDGKLTFVSEDGSYRLRQIATPTFGMKFKESAGTRLAKRSGARTDTVAINLQ